MRSPRAVKSSRVYSLLTLSYLHLCRNTRGVERVAPFAAEFRCYTPYEDSRISYGSGKSCYNGRCLEREQTDEILLSSLLGFSVSWFVMEPLWILLITVAPCLCNTRFMNWANDRANDVSLDLSMLMG